MMHAQETVLDNTFFCIPPLTPPFFQLNQLGKQTYSEVWGSRNSDTCGWECKLVQPLWKALAGSPQIAKQIPLTQKFNFQEFILQMYWHMLVVALFIITKIGNNLNVHQQGTVCIRVVRANNRISWRQKNQEVYYVIVWSPHQDICKYRMCKCHDICVKREEKIIGI